MHLGKKTTKRNFTENHRRLYHKRLNFLPCIVYFNAGVYILNSSNVLKRRYLRTSKNDARRKQIKGEARIPRFYLTDKLVYLHCQSPIFIYFGFLQQYYFNNNNK